MVTLEGEAQAKAEEDGQWGLPPWALAVCFPRLRPERVPGGLSPSAGPLQAAVPLGSREGQEEGPRAAAMRADPPLTRPPPNFPKKTLRFRIISLIWPRVVLLVFGKNCRS